MNKNNYISKIFTYFFLLQTFVISNAITSNNNKILKLDVYFFGAYD